MFLLAFLTADHEPSISFRSIRRIVVSTQYLPTICHERFANIFVNFQYFLQIASIFFTKNFIPTIAFLLTSEYIEAGDSCTYILHT